MHRVFCAPLRYVQGEGVTERLAGEIGSLGIHGPVLVVGGRSAVAVLTPVWAATMSAAGWHHQVRVFGGECTAAEIDAVAAEARSFGATVIVGAGGGKCLDATRAAAGRPNMQGGAATQGALALARACRDTVLADGEAALAAARERRVTLAVERIIEANTLLSGLGFESAGLAAAHAVHNGLTVLPGTHAVLHGEKVAFGTLVQMVLDGTPAEEFAAVLRFCHAVGLPVTLAQLGLPPATAADIEAVAVRATQPGETILNLPRPVTVADVAAAIREADGRAAQITDPS